MTERRLKISAQKEQRDRGEQQTDRRKHQRARFQHRMDSPDSPRSPSPSPNVYTPDSPGEDFIYYELLFEFISQCRVQPETGRLFISFPRTATLNND